MENTTQVTVPLRIDGNLIVSDLATKLIPLYSIST
jgi:hypothetical protein